MTRTPIDHPDGAGRQHHAPHRMRPQQLDVVRAGDVDERSSPRAAAQPMITADALASIDMAWILAFIFLRSRSTRDRLPSASDRLPPAFCWIAMTMPKKFASGHRDALVELAAGLAERDADRLRLDDRAELALDRLGRVGGDDAQAVEQRQTGLDAAHDDVDGIGKCLQELGLAPLLEELEQPERQAAARRECRCRAPPAGRRRS